ADTTGGRDDRELHVSLRVIIECWPGPGGSMVQNRAAPRSARFTRIATIVMTRASRMVPAATRKAREEPVAGAWWQAAGSAAWLGRTGWPACVALATTRDAWAWMLLATAVQATVPSTASPIEPPTCWPVLRMLAATPDSLSATRDIATRVAGTNSRPRPAAITSSGPSTAPA